MATFPASCSNPEIKSSFGDEGKEGKEDSRRDDGVAMRNQGAPLGLRNDGKIPDLLLEDARMEGAPRTDYATLKEQDMKEGGTTEEGT